MRHHETRGIVDQMRDVSVLHLIRERVYWCLNRDRFFISMKKKCMKVVQITRQKNFGLGSQ